MTDKAKVIVAGVLVSVAIVGLWFVLLWNPTKTKLSDAQAKEQAAQDRASLLQTRLATLKSYEENQDVLEADRAELSQAIPDEDQLDDFIIYVNRTAESTGVSFVTISPAPPAAPAAGAPGAVAGGPSVVALQLQVTGDYFAILRFMDSIRDGDRLVTVENFSLAKGGEGGQMSASIGGRMFVVGPLPTAAPAAPTPTA